MPEKSTKKRGRPSHKPSEDSRRQVESMAGFGLKADHIADVVGVSRATLFKHYGEDIKSGNAKATSQVHQTAFRMATSGQTPAMTMFWLKCRAGWRETNVLEIASLPKLEVVLNGD